MLNATFKCTSCDTEFVAQFPDDVSEEDIPDLLIQALTNAGWKADWDKCICFRCLNKLN